MWSLQNVLPYADCKLPVIYATLHKSLPAQPKSRSFSTCVCGYSSRNFLLNLAIGPVLSPRALDGRGVVGAVMLSAQN